MGCTVGGTLEAVQGEAARQGGAGRQFLVIGSREFPPGGRGGSFLCEGFFSSPVSPVIFLKAGLGLEGEQALAGVVGVPLCQVNPSTSGSHEPSPPGV